MNLVQENNDNWDFHEEASPEQSVSAENSDTCVVFGDPEVLPRVGEEYQVEVPPLMTKSYYVSNTSIKHNRKVHDDFHMGLAIPVVWIKKEDETVKHESLKLEIFLEDDLRERFSDPDLTQRELVLEQEFDVKVCGNMVPGSSSESWSCMEEESFLLSLYIFGKNLVQVKNFMEGRNMGDVLSFYYGKFYRSEKHRRWSECRKVRGRRCVYGQRLFTGWRQHELLSRLFSHELEERKSALLEVSKTFTEGKILFEEYVFALKAIVGLKDLIDAVGIGKGKQDLSGFAMDPLKSSQAASSRQEIPSGKACSMLTPSEIVQFLTGDFRLSKARTSDLFWEAVWPRLLARGWHSEQPTSHGFTIGTKQSLVFLVPGIKKFVARKLVKGNHYFDSVSDVLSKVASNPWMLELENGSVRAGENAEENRWDEEMKMDKEDVLNQPRHCYLQPRTPNHESDAAKFTVVDTSLACGKSFKIRELRSLPAGIVRNSNGRSRSRSRSDSNDRNSVSSENSIDKLNFDENNDKIRISLDHRDFSRGGSKQRSQTSSQRTRPNVKNKVQKRCRQGLNVCDQSETSQKSKQEEATCSTDSFHYSENSHFQVDQPQEKSSSNSSIREHGQDMAHPRELIDLNVPVPMDNEIGELSLVENGDGHGRTNQVLLCPNTIKTTQNHQILRRQSTRNRPPTTRALEALALGFLDVKQKRKAKDEQLMLGPSRRARAKVRSSENSRSITEDSKTEETENSMSNSNCESTFAAKVQSLANYALKP